ncbi:plasmid replication protein RepC [Segnochrobactrum spirostomi]|uniref:Uncharacterized protein n=1 Tax=Segnochrobactrum spirostomi TaxID=2608987 RepID=A0A6A7Y9H3_9HYPH|nr:plasmid replication protein RepC [Segnochrobactrum spirostomi]MQT15017.1 hypothetical protein [Segnochrobactrum spirostomi]
MEPATSPFGARRLSFAIIAGQAKAKACPPHVVVDKWKVLRTVIEARQKIGISDRAAAVLSALLSFHPETELKAASPLVVFPSNRELSLRAHSMPEATLRRHLAALVEAGLIVRRDSPNGKRYVRRDEKGAIGMAYGFDLSPLVARAAEFESYAVAERQGREAVRRLREEITLLRRDIAKTLAFVAEEAVPGDWTEIGDAFAPLSSQPCRGLDAATLRGLSDALSALRDKVRKTLDFLMNVPNMDGIPVHCERHKEESNPSLSLKTHFEVELNAIEEVGDRKTSSPQRRGGAGEECTPDRPRRVVSQTGSTNGDEDPVGRMAHRATTSSQAHAVPSCPSFAPRSRPGPGNCSEHGLAAITPGLGPDAHAKRWVKSPVPPSVRPLQMDNRAPTAGSGRSVPAVRGPSNAAPLPSPGFDLQGVLAACPDIRAFNRHGVASWRDLVDAAAVARSALGIGADAWREARAVMGDVAASTVIATILQRVETIDNPGGYLRTLTAKARTGAFSPAPLLRTLLKEQARVV